jgi:hypothetical protein
LKRGVAEEKSRNRGWAGGMWSAVMESDGTERNADCFRLGHYIHYRLPPGVLDLPPTKKKKSFFHVDLRTKIFLIY